MQRVLPKDAILIPRSAQQVFSGQIFDVYQWPQQLFDGQLTTFEMLRRPDTVLIMAVKDGQLVMLHEQQPNRQARTNLPGGRVEPTDASWLAAAQRELLEETGLRFASWRLVDVIQPQTKIEWFVATYIAWDFESQQQSQHDAGERITMELLTLPEVKQAAVRISAYESSLLRGAADVEDLLRLPEFEGAIIS